MITFNQLKYNTVWYTMGQVPWIRLILLLLFLTLSTLVYYFSIQMHEATIFKISGRVDFLNMPILDKIENKTKEWWNKDIESVEGSSFTLFYIMQNWFLQEKPLKIEKYADILGIRAGFNKDASTQNKMKDIDQFFQFISYMRFTSGAMRKDYSFLRTHNKAVNSHYDRHFIYDEQIFSNFVDKTSTRDSFLYRSDPFANLFETERIWYGEAVTPFRTMAKKQKNQSLVWNIGYNEDGSISLGNLTASIVDPLLLRYMFLSNYETSDSERFSELDIFTREEDLGKFTDFDYSKVSHVDLAPGDWLYLPSNWWIQLSNRMQEKLPGKAEPKVDEIFEIDDKEVNIKWIEYIYSNLSKLEDEALTGLEMGYGS